MYEKYVKEKQMMRGRPKTIQTLSETILTQKSLDIAVTKLIVKKVLPVALADDEHFQEYSWGMSILSTKFLVICIVEFHFIFHL